MKSQAGLTLCFVCHLGLATANDSTAGLDGGNIVFRKSDGIEMLQEQLYISPERVRVRYEFRNTTAADIKTRVGFPIPPFDKEPDGDVNYDPNSTNPLAFSTKVDGRAVPVAMQRREKNGKVELIYNWDQVFPADRNLVVEHDYKVSPSAFFYSPEVAEYRTRYCIEPGLERQLKARMTVAQPDVTVMAVAYILTTGNNWKGPIGNFRLVLDKGRADTLVSLCGRGYRKISPTQFEWTKRDFRPGRDLDILFIPPKSYWQSDH
jgi:hypothetical protein